MKVKFKCSKEKFAEYASTGIAIATDAGMTVISNTLVMAAAAVPILAVRNPILKGLTIACEGCALIATLPLFLEWKDSVVGSVKKGACDAIRDGYDDYFEFGKDEPEVIIS